MSGVWRQKEPFGLVIIDEVKFTANLHTAISLLHPLSPREALGLLEQESLIDTSVGHPGVEFWEIVNLWDNCVRKRGQASWAERIWRNE